MKLLCFADTHGYPQRMLDAVAAEDGADACFFLGDGARDPAALRAAYPKLPLYAVYGNCDPSGFEALQGLAPFGGVLFFYTHGHALHVKNGLEELWHATKQSGAGVALYGHTHIPHYECLGGIHMFNPGALSMPRQGPPSYGVITVKNGVPAFEIVRVI